MKVSCLNTVALQTQCRIRVMQSWTAALNLNESRSQVFWACVGSSHKENGWVCASIKLKPAQTYVGGRTCFKGNSTKGLGNPSFKWSSSSRCIEQRVVCLLLHWLIKTWNGERGGRKSAKEEDWKRVMSVSIWNLSAGEKLQLTPLL